MEDLGNSVALVRYDAMCVAIRECERVDEAKEIRAKAIALEAYARQANNHEAEEGVRRIRIRAERKCGELLQEMQDQGQRESRGGSRGNQYGPPKSNVAILPKKTLAQLGITNDQSALWQKLAKVPGDDFEQRLAEPDPSTEKVAGTSKSRPPVDPRSLWIWGRLCDFERDDYLGADPHDIYESMTDPMKEDVARLTKLVIEWLGKLNEEIR